MINTRLTSFKLLITFTTQIWNLSQANKELRLNIDSLEYSAKDLRNFPIV